MTSTVLSRRLFGCYLSGRLYDSMILGEDASWKSGSVESSDSCERRASARALSCESGVARSVPQSHVACARGQIVVCTDAARARARARVVPRYSESFASAVSTVPLRLVRSSSPPSGLVLSL